MSEKYTLGHTIAHLIIEQELDEAERLVRENGGFRTYEFAQRYKALCRVNRKLTLIQGGKEGES